MRSIESASHESSPLLRVAYVAYHFPPLGGAGTQRSLKFAVYLPAFGFEPIVITGPGASRGRWTPHDESLVEELPPAVRVRRGAGPEPEPTDGWLGRMNRWLLTPTRWDEWWQHGVVDVVAELEAVDIILISMSPFATAVAAARASAQAGVPWVAELRDPWALDEMMAYPTRLHRVAELRRMRRALASASAIVMTAPEAARRLGKAFPELADRVVVVPNGYDEADFAMPTPQRTDEKFRIAHTGYFHTDEAGRSYATALRRRLGGELLGVDVSTRTHLCLLAAVRRLIRDEPELRDVIEIHLGGVTSTADREAAEGDDFVRLLGYLPHAESISLIRSADLLFLPMQKIRAGERAGLVPGKTYEYLATGKPILAAVPEGDARDIVRAAGTGLVCDPDDVATMAGIIRAEVARWQAGARGPSLDETYISQFERKVLTAQLAEVLHRVAGATKGGQRPRSVRVVPDLPVGRKS